VATFESYLLGVLMEHESGGLVAASDEVFKVPLSPTVGAYSLSRSIGTLKELMVNAALTAIMTGREKVSIGDLGGWCPSH